MNYFLLPLKKNLYKKKRINVGKFSANELEIVVIQENICEWLRRYLIPKKGNMVDIGTFSDIKERYEELPIKKGVRV